MKHLISTLILSSFIAANAKADHRLSDLRIRTYDNRPVIVSLDQRQYNTPGTAVMINDILPGRHFIKVWSVSRPYSYRHGRILLYNGFIDIPASAEVRAMVTRNSGIRINEIRPNNIPDPYDPYDPYPAPMPDPCGTPAAPYTFNDFEFNSLLNTIDHQSFESTRMQVARQAVRQQGAISTGQVAAIINLFSFDSNKLEFAKFAYDYTIDRQRYHELYNLFSFDSSVRELSEYIDSRM